MFSLICAWINSWANNHEAGDLRRQHAHNDGTVMLWNYKQNMRAYVLQFNYVLEQHVNSRNNIQFHQPSMSLVYAHNKENTTCQHCWPLWRAVKLPWIYSRAPLTLNAVPGNIQGNLNRYCQTSNIRCTLIGNKTVDNSDVVGELQLHLQHLASMDWAKTTANRDLSFGIWCTL